MVTLLKKYEVKMPAELRSWYVMWRATVVICVFALSCLMVHDWLNGLLPGDISRLAAILLLAALLVDCFVSVASVTVISDEIKTKIIDLIEQDDMQIADYQCRKDSMREVWTIRIMRNRWYMPPPEERPWEQH